MLPCRRKTFCRQSEQASLRGIPIIVNYGFVINCPFSKYFTRKRFLEYRIVFLRTCWSPEWDLYLNGHNLIMLFRFTFRTTTSWQYCAEYRRHVLLIIFSFLDPIIVNDRVPIIYIPYMKKCWQILVVRSWGLILIDKMEQGSPTTLKGWTPTPKNSQNTAQLFINGWKMKTVRNNYSSVYSYNLTLNFCAFFQDHWSLNFSNNVSITLHSFCLELVGLHSVVKEPCVMKVLLAFNLFVWIILFMN